MNTNNPEHFGSYLNTASQSNGSVRNIVSNNIISGSVDASQLIPGDEDNNFGLAPSMLSQPRSLPRLKIHSWYQGYPCSTKVINNRSMVWCHLDEENDQWLPLIIGPIPKEALRIFKGLSQMRFEDVFGVNHPFPISNEKISLNSPGTCLSDFVSKFSMLKHRVTTLSEVSRKQKHDLCKANPMIMINITPVRPAHCHIVGEFTDESFVGFSCGPVFVLRWDRFQMSSLFKIYSDDIFYSGRNFRFKNRVSTGILSRFQPPRVFNCSLDCKTLIPVNVYTDDRSIHLDDLVLALGATVYCGSKGLVPMDSSCELNRVNCVSYPFCVLVYDGEEYNYCFNCFRSQNNKLTRRQNLACSKIYIYDNTVSSFAQHLLLLPARTTEPEPVVTPFDWSDINLLETEVINSPEGVSLSDVTSNSAMACEALRNSRYTQFETDKLGWTTKLGFKALKGCIKRYDSMEHCPVSQELFDKLYSVNNDTGVGLGVDWCQPIGSGIGPIKFVRSSEQIQHVTYRLGSSSPGKINYSDDVVQAWYNKSLNYTIFVPADAKLGSPWHPQDSTVSSNIFDKGDMRLSSESHNQANDPPRMIDGNSGVSNRLIFQSREEIFDELETVKYRPLSPQLGLNITGLDDSLSFSDILDNLDIEDIERVVPHDRLIVEQYNEIDHLAYDVSDIVDDNGDFYIPKVLVWNESSRYVRQKPPVKWQPRNRLGPKQRRMVKDLGQFMHTVLNDGLPAPIHIHLDLCLDTRTWLSTSEPFKCEYRRFFRELHINMAKVPFSEQDKCVVPFHRSMPSFASWTIAPAEGWNDINIQNYSKANNPPIFERWETSKDKGGCFISATHMKRFFNSLGFEDGYSIMSGNLITIMEEYLLDRFSDVRFTEVGPGEYHLEPEYGVDTTIDDIRECGLYGFIGLTTVVVLGTIGDVGPSLDVAAATWMDASIAEGDNLETISDEMFQTEVETFATINFGVRYSDILPYSKLLARYLAGLGGEKFGLKISGRLVNMLGLRGYVYSDKEIVLVPTGFEIRIMTELEEFEMFNITVEEHYVEYPPDMVVVTHRDHKWFVKERCPDADFVPLSVECKPFIALGQAVFEFDSQIVNNLRQIRQQLEIMFGELLYTVQQSDLIFANSGTSFYGLLTAAFPDRQVYEICPVPRENNGTCPEMYIKFVSDWISKKPEFSHYIGNFWSGDFLEQLATSFGLHIDKTKELKKIHSVSPIMYDKFKLKSRNVGFKPFDRFIRQIYSPNERVVYITLGSCEKILPGTLDLCEKLTIGADRVDIDERWFTQLSHINNAVSKTHFDHAFNFWQYSFVIHHGGSGTTNTCLEVGVPQYIIPQIGDQFVWRDTIHEMGQDINIDDINKSLAEFTPQYFKGALTYSPIRARQRFYTIIPWQRLSDDKLAIGRILFSRLDETLEPCFDLETYWLYTDSLPHYYTMQHRVECQAEIEKLRLRFTKDNSNMLLAIGKSVWTILGFSSSYQILRKFRLTNLWVHGWRPLHKYCRVLNDAMVHYLEMANYIGMDMDWVEKQVWKSERLPTAEYRAYIPTMCGIATTIKTAENFALFEEGLLSKNKHNHATIFLFHLFTPLLGRDIGIFHSVLKYNGVYYQLDRIAGGGITIDVMKQPPIISSGHPLAKAITFDVPTDFVLDIRKYSSLLNDSTYRIAGDNCLFFSNLLTYELTGCVIPWEQFGLYGKTFATSFRGIAKDWAKQTIFITDNDIPFEYTDSSSLPEFGLSIPDWVENWKLTKGPKPSRLVYPRDCFIALCDFQNEYAEKLTYGVHNKSVLIYLAQAAIGFGLSVDSISNALWFSAKNNLSLPYAEVNMLEALKRCIKYYDQTPLGQSTYQMLSGLTTGIENVRKNKKSVWTPLLKFNVPSSIFFDRTRFIKDMRLESTILLPNKSFKTIIDLPEIFEKYQEVFPSVKFSDLQMELVQPGEYRLNYVTPLRKPPPTIEGDLKTLVDKLLSLSGGEIGIFTLRYATDDMAERVTERYLSGVPEGFMDEDEIEELADAIFRNEPHLFANAEPMDPEVVWKKWNTKYSAGFPFRFNEKGRAKRADLIKAAGGKEEFIKAVRKYIADPEKCASVSHVFIKDEVLPKSKADIGKIRTIIAQDPLAYFCEMYTDGDQNKRFDPLSTSSVGISVQHGELAEMARLHSRYKHHYAADARDFDSRLSRDFMTVIKRVRQKGYDNQPKEKREALYNLIDVVHENLFVSWLADIHTGKTVLKRQGGSTGRASTTGSNEIYIRALFLKGWKDVTGLSYDKFYEGNKLTSYSDDNFWSTNLPRSQFNMQLLSDALAKYGVVMSVDFDSDSLQDLTFLSKKFRLEQEKLDEVKFYTGQTVVVAIEHDKEKLVTKFSDIKKHPYLTYRWDRAISFLQNCAHHRDLHDSVWEYCEKLYKQMQRRTSLKRHADKNKPMTYEEVMKLSYIPDAKSKIVLSTPETRTWFDAAIEKWEAVKVQALTFDVEVDGIGKIMRSVTETLRVVGFKFEEEGLDLYDPNYNHFDHNYTLEHHLYLCNGCPPEFSILESLARKSPFSEFMRLKEFWEKRHLFDMSTQKKNNLIMKIGFLYLCYTFVGYLEQVFQKIPVVGSIYKMFTQLEILSADMYSKANAVFYMLYGDSSKLLSSMIPKDNYKHLKRLAVTLFSAFTDTDLPDSKLDPDDFRMFIEGAISTIANVNEIVIGKNWNPLLPIGTLDKKIDNCQTTQWQGLDHSDSVLECNTLLSEGKVPLITAAVGAGKSTDFIVNLKQKYKTVYLGLPRKILVDTNPILHKRCYMGSNDSLQNGLINGATYGYLRLALNEVNNDEILVLDEFHELNEDAIFLYNRFKGRVILVTATPEFGVTPIDFKPVEVKLTKSRVTRFTVSESIKRKPLSFETEVMELLKSKTKVKTLVIHPSKKVINKLFDMTIRYFPNVKAQLVYRGHVEIMDNMWYFGTSVVDAGLTIPGLQYVVDSGLSGSFINNDWGIRPSTKAVAEQRKGRTGRTCDGRYVRLNKHYSPTIAEFNWVNVQNNPKIATEWGITYNGNMKPKVFDQNIPWPIQHLILEKKTRAGFSALVFGICLNINRGDVQRTKDMYQEIIKWGIESAMPQMNMYNQYQLCSLDLAIRKFNSLESNWIDIHSHQITHMEIPRTMYEFTGVKTRPWLDYL